MKRLVSILAVLFAVLAAYATLIRRWHLRWGSTEEERPSRLPGDDAIPEPDLEATRAITVRAYADDVWPWVAQMGQGRGGLYSYDGLENLVGCRMRSAEEIVPEWQDVAVGDAFRLHPDVPLEVIDVVPGRSLVVRGGVAMDGASAPPFDFVWAFVLDERLDGSTRLVARERYAYTKPWGALVVEPVEALSFVMTRKMLQGIRDRAERNTTAISV